MTSDSNRSEKVVLSLVHVTHGRQIVNFRKRCACAESRTPAKYVYIVQGHRRKGRRTEYSHIIIISRDFGDVYCDNNCAGFLFCSMKISIFFMSLECNWCFFTFFFISFSCLFLLCIFLTPSSFALYAWCNKSFGLFHYCQDCTLRILDINTNFATASYANVLFRYTECPWISFIHRIDFFL